VIRELRDEDIPAVARIWRDLRPDAMHSVNGLGHLLGSSGSIEAVATVLCLRHEELHPVPAGSDVDPELPVSLVLDRPLPLPGVKAAISTSLAFGGSNAALVFSRWTNA